VNANLRSMLNAVFAATGKLEPYRVIVGALISLIEDGEVAPVAKEVGSMILIRMLLRACDKDVCELFGSYVDFWSLSRISDENSLEAEVLP